MYLPNIILLLVLFLYLPLSHADQVYGPLRNGETLWTIAPKVKPNDSITRHQMIIALLRANPHAFSLSCNINSLKVNQTLTIPDLAEIEQLPHQQALEAYKQQNAAWRAFKRQNVPIECETVEESEIAEESEDQPNVVAMTNAQPDPIEKPQNITSETEEITLPTLSPAPENTDELTTQALVNEIEETTESLETNQFNAKQMNYLPIIIVLAVVLFVLILAYLFRNHTENKPIPENLKR